MDRATAWSLWRQVLSFKYKPIAKQDPPGFIDMFSLKDALVNLMHETPFLSDGIFRFFNKEVRLELDPITADRMYNKICAATPDFRGAGNLVAWEHFQKQFRQQILR